MNCTSNHDSAVAHLASNTVFLSVTSEQQTVHSLRSLQTCSASLLYLLSIWHRLHRAWLSARPVPSGGYSLVGGLALSLFSWDFGSCDLLVWPRPGSHSLLVARALLCAPAAWLSAEKCRLFLWVPIFTIRSAGWLDWCSRSVWLLSTPRLEGLYWKLHFEVRWEIGWRLGEVCAFVVFLLRETLRFRWET